MALTTADWVALGVVLVAAVGGPRRGLVRSALSLAGLAAGAYAGSRVAPHLLHGGASSAWTPLAGLVGAILGATLLQTLATIAGSFVRGGLRLTPLRVLDSLGGLCSAPPPGSRSSGCGRRRAARARPDAPAPGGAALGARPPPERRVPPRRLLHLLARVDPFPPIAGPAAPSQPPSAGVLRDPTIRAAADSVVKILGTACGIGVEGSGWFARADLVVTAAHVVAGEQDTIVQIPGEQGSRPAEAVGFDVHDDVAVLRVAGAHATPLPLADPRPGTAVAILGYPENGGLDATPGRIGRTAVVLTQDALGHGPVARTITAVAGEVRHGDSGGPAVDASGAVQSTIFAARIGAASGYGVPASVVRRDLAAARGPVSTGGCTG